MYSHKSLNIPLSSTGIIFVVIIGIHLWAFFLLGVFKLVFSFNSDRYVK